MQHEDFFYHGSNTANLVSLSRHKSTCTAAFGPVIYLSKKYEVAACYGTVYKVKVLGDWDKVIDLNNPISLQTNYAYIAMNSLFKNFKESVFSESNEVRWELARLGGAYGMKTVYDCLSLLNIWMVYGKLHGTEISGLMDRGVQYGVIQSKRLSIDGVVTHEMYYDAENVE